MVTPATAVSPRLRYLVQTHASQIHVHVQPCPGLAGAIEAGVLHGHALIEILSPLCDSVRAADVDFVVLGCTHYAFVAAQIQTLIGEGVTLVDTATAIAEQVVKLWRHVDNGHGSTNVRVLSTGATDTMRLILDQCPALGSIVVERAVP
jgi:glutamate racemase